MKLNILAVYLMFPTQFPPPTFFKYTCQYCTSQSYCAIMYFNTNSSIVFSATYSTRYYKLQSRLMLINTSI